MEKYIIIFVQYVTIFELSFTLLVPPDTSMTPFQVAQFDQYHSARSGAETQDSAQAFESFVFLLFYQAACQ